MVDLEYIRLKRDEVNNGRILEHAEGLRFLIMLEEMTKPVVSKRMIVSENDGTLHVDNKKIISGIPYRLTRIVKCLAERSPRFQTRDQLITYAYGEGWSVEDRNIDSHLKRLRRILPDDCPVHIVTRYGVGYAMLFRDDSEVSTQRLYASVIKSPLLR